MEPSAKSRRKYFDRTIVKPTFSFFENINDHGLAERDGQTNMALDIAEAIGANEHIVVEAGVGIGKSFAYLYPGTQLASLTGRPIVISTSSIALSEQLVDDAQRVLRFRQNSSLPIVLGKGMNNYICKSRVNEVIEQKRALKKSTQRSFSAKERMMLQYPDIVLQRAGVCSERTSIPVVISDAHWNQINVTKCDRYTCEHVNECKFIEMRTAIGNAGRARIIIINHDLLLAHLLNEELTGEGFINDRIRMVIIDEAHNLEEKARAALTTTWSLKKINVLMTQLQNSYYISGSSASSERNIETIRNQCRKLFEELQGYIRQIKSKPGRTRDADRFFLPQTTSVSYDKLMKTVSNVYYSVNGWFASQRRGDILDELSKFNEFVEILANIEKHRNKHLLWLSGTEHNKGNIAISYAPSNIGERLQRLLFSKDLPIVLTSATLCQPTDEIDSMYEYVCSSIGFDGERMEPKLSPFDYDRQAMLYIPNNVTEPNNVDKDKYIADLTDHIAEVAQITSGRTMVLFTSKDDLSRVHQSLEQKNLSFPIIKQSEGVSPASIIAEFKRTKGLALVTGAFWEGINIPGQDLTSLIIARLPFPVPDPIIEYKISKVASRYDVLVPEMILKLRQGAGRLIRSETEKVILTILDSRVSKRVNKHYRQDVLKALPIKNDTDSIEDVINFAQNINYM